MIFPLVVFCEGQDQSLDVRLIEACRLQLETELTWLRQVEIRPAGGKTDLKPTVRVHRQQGSRGNRPQGGRPPEAFALRDRDFLRGQHLAEMRLGAMTEVREPWPLTYHSIESYLLWPAFVHDALGTNPELQLDVVAAARLWIDVAKAVAEDLNWQARGQRIEIEVEPPSRDAAIACVSQAVQGHGDELDWGVAALTALVDQFHADFVANAPLWGRLDGKEMLRALDESGGHHGQLRDRLMSYAEQRGQLPEPLIVDLRTFFNRVGELLALG